MMVLSKDSVNYRPATGSRHCGNCVMFHDGSCDLVGGEIQADDVCDRWEGKMGKPDPEMDLVKLGKLAAHYNWLAIKADELRPVDPKNADKYSAQCWAISVETYPTLVKLFDAGYEVESERLGWDVEQLVMDSLRKWLIKSEETPYLSEHHAPIGHEGLWHTPGKKVPHKEQLPSYIQNVRNALMRAGHDEQSAHAMAVAAIKRWASGQGAWGHKGKVTPVVREAAQKALEEWERLKAEHSG